MPFPLQITYREVHESDALERLVRQEAAKLERYYNRIISGRVTLEYAYAKHHENGPFRVRVVLTPPGGELVVTHIPDGREIVGDEDEEARLRTSDGANAPYRDIGFAVREAFKKTRRQLQERVRKVIDGRHDKGVDSVENSENSLVGPSDS